MSFNQDYINHINVNCIRQLGHSALWLTGNFPLNKAVPAQTNLIHIEGYNGHILNYENNCWMIATPIVPPESISGNSSIKLGSLFALFTTDDNGWIKCHQELPEQVNFTFNWIIPYGVN